MSRREGIRAGHCAKYGNLNGSGALRALASIWSEHPDHQQDWAV